MSGEPSQAPQRPRRVRLYFSTRDLRDRVFRLLGTCFDGFWLGVLSREHLHMLDESFYADPHVIDGRPYSYGDDEYNARGLDHWEEAAVGAHFSKGSRVVVTGAGGGREVLALLERGFDAVGYEPNPAFVAAGDAFLRGRGHEGRLHVTARDLFPAGTESCDAVMVGWGSYMLIAGRSHRIAFLRAARAHLQEGDPILLSFFQTRRTPRYLARVARIANVLRRLRHAEPADPGDTCVPHYVHYFTRNEVGEELGAGGFDLVAFEVEPYAHAVGRAA